MIKEFSIAVCCAYLFPSSEDNSRLSKQEFFKKVQTANFFFLKANELRKRFTEYLIQNKHRALLPTKKAPLRCTYTE